MKRLLFLLVATLMTYSAQALILETIELKDGTVLQGYTAGMKKNGKIIFMADKISMTVTVSSSDVFERTKLENGGERIKTFKGEEYVTKSDAIVESEDNISFPFTKSFSENKSKDIDPYSIKKISREVPDKSLLNGVRDKVTTVSTNHSVEGYVTAQVPGSHWELTSNNGNKSGFKSADVDILEKVRINEDMTLYDQSVLIDTYVLKNGEKVSGALKKKNWTNNTITLEDSNSKEIVVNANDVVEYYSVRNQKYQQEFDKDIVGDNVVINNTNLLNLEKIESKGHEMKVLYRGDVINLEKSRLIIEVNYLNDGLRFLKISEDYAEKDFKKNKYCNIPLTMLEPITPSATRMTKKTSRIIVDNIDCGYYLLTKVLNRETENRTITKREVKGVLFKVETSNCNEENKELERQSGTKIIERYK